LKIKAAELLSWSRVTVYRKVSKIPPGTQTDTILATELGSSASSDTHAFSSGTQIVLKWRDPVSCRNLTNIERMARERSTYVSVPGIGIGPNKLSYFCRN